VPSYGITSRFILLVAFLLLSASGNADADAFDRSRRAGVDNLEEQKKALKVIEDFAERLCDTVPLSGSANNYELSGNAKAELNTVIKQLVNLGVEGAAKYQSSEWQGVLQQDLAGQLSQSRDCKLRVFENLSNKLLSKVNDAPKYGSQKPDSGYRIVIQYAVISNKGADIGCDIQTFLMSQCNMMQYCTIPSGYLPSMCSEYYRVVDFFPERIIYIQYKCRSSQYYGIEFPRLKAEWDDQEIIISC
jgi:hypothetical protein